MKKLTSLFLALSAFAIITVSCSKDSNASTSPPATAVSGKWYNTTTATTHAGTTSPDVPFNYGDCPDQKSFYDFQAGGVLDEGYLSSQCVLTHYTDHWTLSGDALNIVLDTGEPKNYKVISVTATDLVLRNYLPIDNASYTDYKFTRQQ